MHKLLIVSPKFPPVNAADMHRVRVSLPYFSDFGWEALVLSVQPQYVEERQDALLLDTIPTRTLSWQVKAFPAKWTRKLGLGDLGMRAWPFLYATGLKIIRQHKIDLIYFSTTAFVAMTLGRAWKFRTGTPFVLDIQDPWHSDYFKNRPKNKRPPKFWLSSRLHAVMEPWTMKETCGLIAVSDDYIRTLQERYPWLANRPCRTLPFAGSDRDFQVVRANPQMNRFFEPGDGDIHGVYIGRGGADMGRALEIIFGALRRGIDERPELFSRVKLHFVGTDYARDGFAQKTILPIADKYRVQAQVAEYPQRIPYFETLHLLLDADFLLVPGSDDPQYTASKIYPYILARKPLLAVFHQNSSVCELLKKTRSGSVLPFGKKSQTVDQDELLNIWAQILKALPFTPPTDWIEFAPFTAEAMTRKQCELFDQVLQESRPATS